MSDTSPEAIAALVAELRLAAKMEDIAVRNSLVALGMRDAESERLSRNGAALRTAASALEALARERDEAQRERDE